MYAKLDDFTLSVEKPKTVLVEQQDKSKTVNTNYDYGFLLKQRQSITEQRDEMIALKEAELAEVNELIAEAEKLGIGARPEPKEEVTVAR